MADRPESAGRGTLSKGGIKKWIRLIKIVSRLVTRRSHGPKMRLGLVRQ
jgi:hypothetical protein